jgi:hypothetical protein
MPRVRPKQEGSDENEDSALGDAIPHNGIEEQAARRTHMREQTMARQAAERDAIRTGKDWGRARLDRADAARERNDTLHTNLTRINEDHQTWLRERGLSDLPAIEPVSRIPDDTMAPSGTMDRFLSLLKSLRRGVTLRQWYFMLRELPKYAQVDIGGPRHCLRPRRPVAFEGTIYDHEHAIIVCEQEPGIVSIDDQAEGQESHALT